MPGERLLLLAQSPVLRSGIQAIFADAIPIDQVYGAEGVIEAQAVASAYTPTLIIIQDSLPGVTGFVAAYMLRQSKVDAKILLLSDRLQESDYARACLLGADALVPASIDPQGFVQRVRDVLAGGGSLRVDHVVMPAEERWSDEITRLSAREIAVLDGVVRSLTLTEMARLLLVPESTIKSSVSSLISKLGATDITIAIVTAIRRGIVDLSGHLPAQEPERETSSATTH